ncbi:hypothetical protein E2C01_047972 [Portunus trituberculatus]|uniref:Uncharacterized protein n=1 Tax=Portunus trituberculatus TaxID=210409 RepID=A0A5B7G9A8_PORTR|nr:hypothetical protein [Portunus trituberculatus]
MFIGNIVFFRSCLVWVNWPFAVPLFIYVLVLVFFCSCLPSCTYFILGQWFDGLDLFPLVSSCVAVLRFLSSLTKRQIVPRILKYTKDTREQENHS